MIPKSWSELYPRTEQRPVRLVDNVLDSVHNSTEVHIVPGGEQQAERLTPVRLSHLRGHAELLYTTCSGISDNGERHLAGRFRPYIRLEHYFRNASGDPVQAQCHINPGPS